MRRQSSERFPKIGRLLLAALLTGLCLGTVPAFSAASDQDLQAALQQQVLSQGRRLLGSLRQARTLGLHGDPWAMAYSLEQARRLLDQIDQAQRMLYARRAPNDEGTALRQPPRLSVAPLDERLVIDSPLSNGRRQRLAGLEQYAGFIPLQRVRNHIARAAGALNNRPPDLGRALLATNQALSDIHWQPSLEPAGWSRARDLLLQGYTLALGSRPGAFGRLVRARRRLENLPDGGVYARRLATLLRAPTLDLKALGSLVRDLDRQVQVRRNRAERVRLESATVELEP